MSEIEYIDVNLLKEKLNSFIDLNQIYTDYNRGYDDCLTAVQDTISDIPIAEVKAIVHGLWIHEKDINDEKSDYKCSICDYDDTFYDILIHNNFYKYCTNCGAKMDKKIDNNINNSLNYPSCFISNEHPYPLCKGNNTSECKNCSLWEDYSDYYYPLIMINKIK